MWQRWQNKQPAISQPTHFTQLDRDDDYEDRYLETIMEVDSISSRRQSAHIGLPQLPFRAVPPMREIPQPVNLQPKLVPSKPARMAGGQDLKIDVNVDNDMPTESVSPLSPTTWQERIHDERPVSPIEPIATAPARAPLPDRAYQSQIPRKVSKPSTQDNLQRTKWDEYSGEPASDGRGKEASVRPGVQPVEMQYPQLKERTKQILAGLRDRDTTKNAPWGRAPPPVAADPLDDPPTREPWKGPSGRAAIVAPVKNTPTAPIIPRRHPERNISLMNATHPYIGQQTHEHEDHEHFLRSKPSEDSIRPVVPLKTRNLTPIETPLQSPASITSRYSPEQPHIHQIPAPESPHVRVESPQYDEEPRTPTTPTGPAQPHIQAFGEPVPPFVTPGIGHEQSRFSWTTYTASTAQSPRSLAPTHDEFSSPPHLADLPPPIAIKKRPLSSSPFMHSQPYMQPSYADSNSSVVRKPLPGFQPRSSSLSTATSRAVSTSKSLPPTPTIVEATDKIENLDAQLDSLNRRKRNTSRIVADLDGSLKKNAVVYDMWKRKEVEKNITNHKMELDDIGREIHEISLQLHRTQRKRDREDGYEKPTGLWIKRVTD